MIAEPATSVVAQATSSLGWLQEGASSSPVIIAIHGWASNAQVWCELAKQLPECGVLTLELPGFGVTQCDNRLLNYNNFIGAVSNAVSLAKRQWPACSARDFYIMGWSLGGQIAAEVAARIPDVIAGLITVASNPCFVEQPNWPTAMPASTYDAFSKNFSAGAAKVVQRFNALQAHGAGEPRALRKSMKQYLPALDSAQIPYWQATLAWLAFDARPAYAAYAKPQLHLLAENDALVPANVPLEQYGEVQIIAGASHCLPLESSKAVARAVSVFIKTHCASAMDKSRVARAFSDAAANYDTFAQVQKTTAQNVVRRALKSTINTGKVLDLGAGTGALTRALAEQGASMIALDIAEGMLHVARCHAASYPPVNYLAADAEYLPLRDTSVDGVVSSLAIQWCTNLPLLFAEIYRVLKPGGRAVIATLGPATLRELKLAWQAVDEAVHINAFASRSQVESAAGGAGFDVVIEQQLEQLKYPSLMPLLQALKGIGAHNSHALAPAGLMTRSKFQTLKNAYPSPDGGRGGEVVASYDIFYLELTK